MQVFMRLKRARMHACMHATDDVHVCRALATAILMVQALKETIII